MENVSDKTVKDGEVMREPGERERLLAALSYVGVLFVLPLILGSRSKFVRFHVRQGMIMCAFEFGVMVLGWIPIIGWSASVAVCVVAIIAFVRAFHGREWKIPYVHEWSEKIQL